MSDTGLINQTKEPLVMKTITHKTGYLFQYNGGAEFPVESWHRTYVGAQRAKARNGHLGRVYRLTGDDTSVEVQA